VTSRSIGTAQIVTGTAAAVALLYFMHGILVPLVVAFVLAVLVRALVRFIETRWPKAPHWAVSVLAALVVIGIAAGGIFVMTQGMVQIVAEAPALADRLDQIVFNIGRSFHLKQDLHLSTVVGTVSVPQLAGSILSGLQGFATGFLLMVVYFGFMLAGQRRMSRKIDVAAGSSKRATAIKEVVGRAAEDIETYVWVQTITGVMLTASAVVVMLAVGLNNVLFWTVIFFLLTFIPNIGVTVGSIAPSLFALVQFQTLWQAIAIFAVTQFAAFVVGNFIYPRLQAQTQNIDPIVTLLSLAVWSWLWGLPGAFLAVPLTLMLMMLFAQFESTRWLSALLSNDGKPVFRKPGSNPPVEKGKKS
jgi:predicted PurR-regulated permease PerM